MAEGKEVGKAYVTVHLDDHTPAEYEKMRADLESKPALSIGTKLRGPDVADYEKIKAEVESKAALALSTRLKNPDAGDYDRIKAITEAKSDIAIAVKLESSQAEQGMKNLQSSSSGMALGAAAGWTALGAVLAGPAVALSLGAIAGGFAAIGVMAEKSAPQVGAAFNTMKVTGTDVLQASFQSLTPVIVTSLNQATNAVTKLGPEFAKISSEIAPGFSILTNAILQGAQTAIPAMTSALSQATPMARALAGGMMDMANGFAQFLGRLDFSQASQGLASLLGAVGQLMPVLASVVNAVMPLGNAILSGVLPPVLTLIGGLANGLAPAIQVVAGAITALSPLLNFMAGPTAAILIGVAAMKGFEAVATGLLPVFNTLSAGVSTYGSRLIGMVSSNDAAIGSTTLMTTAQQKAAVSSATAALASAQQAAATAASNLVTLESAAAADVAAVSQEQLAAARVAATVTAEAEAVATVAVNEATAATSFALAPVGIGLGLVAGLMTLFAGNTDKAAPPVQNFTAELDKLANAAPGAAKGILQSSPGLTDLVNKATAAGISVKDLSSAFNEGGSAQFAVQAQLNGTIKSLGDQKTAISELIGETEVGPGVWKESSISISELSTRVGSSTAAFKALTPEQQQAITKYRETQSTLGELNKTFDQNANTQRAAGAVGAQAVKLTADQQAAATDVARQFGLSVSDVAAAFAKLPGAGSTAAGAVMQVTGGFSSGMVAMKNAEQVAADYFTNLQKNADTANQALSSANHSYQQSIQAVADAQHSFTQSQMAVETANKGVETATRGVTDAVHSYEQAQHSVAQANQGVIDANNGVASAEQNLTKAQQSETQAQLALTNAREAATQQLKSLNLQVADQAVSEQRAQMHLFDQLRLSASRNITPDNAAAMLAQPTTTANEAMKLSALDLVAAQNALADTLNTGANLREQVNKANKAGVDGNPAVVSAAQALQNAQQGVASSQAAVLKAHQAVDQAVYSLQQSYWSLNKAQQAITDAQAGVVKAQQAVKDSVWAEEKARIAVKDAIYNQHQALLAIRTAQDAAARANEYNTNSLDQNTQAGRNNMAQLDNMFNAIPNWIQGQDRYKRMVDDTAWAMHVSTDTARDMLVAQDKLPRDFRYSVTAVASMDAQGLFGDITSPTSLTARAKYYAGGGPVDGVGGPKDDSNLAWLSHGEFVQPVDTVDHYGASFMEALRQKKIPKGDDGSNLPAFAQGGLATANLWAAAAGDKFTSAIAAMNVMGMKHPPGLYPYVAPPAGSYGGGPNGAIPTGAHLAMIDAALAADGIARSDWPRWEAGMDVLIQRESSWNPNAVNNWDSNAAAGHPSGGLTQTIASTFAGNRNPSLPNNMFDPVSNIAASINYIRRTYGDISNVQQANPNMPHMGYDQGGFMLDKPALNSTGKPEMVLPPDLTNTLMSLHKMVQGGQSGSSSKPSVSMPINITTVPMDPHETAGAVSTAVMWELRR